MLIYDANLKFCENTYKNETLWIIFTLDLCKNWTGQMQCTAVCLIQPLSMFSWQFTLSERQNWNSIKLLKSPIKYENTNILQIKFFWKNFFEKTICFQQKFHWSHLPYYINLVEDTQIKRRSKRQFYLESLTTKG